MKNKHQNALKTKRAEQVVEGLGVSSGIAIGTAYITQTDTLGVPRYRVHRNKIQNEKKRFKEAVLDCQKQLKKLKQKAKNLPESAAEEMGYLLDAHLAMLSGSRLIRGVEKRIVKDGINAEAAVKDEIESIKALFSKMNDNYLASRGDDVEETGNRLIRNLTKSPQRSIKDVQKNTILIAEDLSPAETSMIDTKKIVGFATAQGGAEGHTAIMARSLGLPAALGVSQILSKVKNGSQIIIDGKLGKVIINPSSATLTEYKNLQHALSRKRRKLSWLSNLPALTKDHVHVGLLANLELPRELGTSLKSGAEGIGLLRSEFLFMNRKTLPSEDEQFESFREIVKGMEGRAVTIRTLDIGGEKLTKTLKGDFGTSANPALGLRAIRFSLHRQDLLETQLSAILRASAYGPIRILLPLISNIYEIIQVRQILKKVISHLKEKNIPFSQPLPPIGVMIEVPGAALAADTLAREADFFAIGSNDLTMYTLAIDRADEQVAYLYNSMHPGVLRLIHFATEAAKRAKIPISVCGEIAGDPRYTALMLGLGIRSLSMVSSNIAPVKYRVRGLTIEDCVGHAQNIMRLNDENVIAEKIKEFNGPL